MPNLLVENAQIIDGTGAPAFPGHLLVEDTRIRDILPFGARLPETDTHVDAGGRVLCPGFIDMHSHADWALCTPDHPRTLACLVEQGVTTVVGGNCGFSPAPMASAKNSAHMKKATSLFTGGALPLSWPSMGDFLDTVDHLGPIVNLAQLAGHASIRMAAADTLRGALSPRDQDACLLALRNALDQGACGLSLGLGYEPGMYAPEAELDAFCRTAKAAGKPVTVHMKALSRISPAYPLTTATAHNLKALREALDMARRTGVTLQLSHFIFVGRHSWTSAQSALKMVAAARAEGVDVMIDAFPYTAGNTLIEALLPAWFLKALPRGFSNPLLLARLRLELEVGFRLVGFMYPDFQVMDAAVDGWEDLNGMTLDQVARKWHISNFKALLRLCRESAGEATMLFHAYSGEPGNEAVLESVLACPWCLFETDAIIKPRGLSNPSALGTFPRLLGPCCRDRQLFPLADAVCRMTGASARRFGLSDRGEIAPGKSADLVIFDPERVGDSPPSGSAPASRPAGIDHVFINGRQVVTDGVYLEGSRFGQVLRN